MKKFIITSFSFLVAITLCAAMPDGRVALDKLPKATHAFIHEYMSSSPVKYAEEMGEHHPYYVVYFENGDKAMFDKSSGKCTGLVMAQGAVPEQLVPKKVGDYVKAHYSSAWIVSMKHRGDKLYASLNDGTKLCFDKDGNLVKRECDTKCCDKSKSKHGDKM